MEDRRATIGRTQPPISDPYGKKGFLQLSQEAAISVRLHSTDSERLSVIYEDEDVQTSSYPCLLGTTDSFKGLMTVIDEFNLWLKQSEVPKKT